MNSNQPLSQQYHEAGHTWARLDAAARMLEEGKTTYLAQQKALLGDIADNKAEKQVKSGEQWSAYIKNMVNAKTEANKAKIDLEFVKMKFWEWQSDGANNRAGSKM